MKDMESTGWTILACCVAIISCCLVIPGCKKTQPCRFTTPKAGASKDALLARALLNTEYYFSNTPAEDRANIYTKRVFSELYRNPSKIGECIDDSVARKSFKIDILSMSDTTASVVINSLDPSRYDWFDTWISTSEVWQIDNNSNWKLLDSTTFMDQNSLYIQTYFVDK